MANNNHCGCRGRRNSDNAYGCLNSVGGRWRWDNYPYYGGPCPDADGDYGCERDNDDDCSCDRENDRRGRKRRRNRGCYGMFMGMLPMAVSANGIVPLVSNSCLCRSDDFAVNCGLITVEEAGTYLATYTVRLPQESTVESTFTLNVNDASQSSAITQVGGAGPIAFTAQAIIDVCDHATVSLRSSDAINITETSAQPLVTLSLVKI